MEYSRTGEIVKGLKKAVARSKYPEDVYVNNHTAIWGSFYIDGSWGYACCHSLIAGSYCTGEAGKLANQATSAAALLGANADKEPEEAPKSLAELHREKLAKAEQKKPESAQEAEDIELDKKKLRAALAEEKKRKALAEEDAWEQTKRSKTEVSKEEMEAYRLSRQAFDDPMANYEDKEE